MKGRDNCAKLGKKSSIYPEYAPDIILSSNIQVYGRISRNFRAYERREIIRLEGRACESAYGAA